MGEWVSEWVGGRVGTTPKKHPPPVRAIEGGGDDGSEGDRLKVPGAQTPRHVSG